MKTEIEKAVLAENNISARPGNPAVSILVFIAAITSLAIALFLNENNEARMPLFLTATILAVTSIVKLFITPAVLVYTPTNEVLNKKELLFEQNRKNEVSAMLEQGELNVLEREGHINGNMPIKLTIYTTESKAIALCRLYQFIPYTFEPISDFKVIKK